MSLAQAPNWLAIVPAAVLAATLLAGCSPVTVVNALSPSAHYQADTGLAYGEERRQRLDLYRPVDAADDAPVVVFFYGNGWREGNRGNFEFVASGLTRAGIVVLIPDYRGHPHAAFPAFMEDGARAVHWARDNLPGVASGERPLFVMGHSAGAHIAALLALDERYLRAAGDSPPPLAGFIGLSGPYDFLPLDRGYLENVFPAESRARSQPIEFVSAAAPPTLLVHGTDDGAALAEHSRRLAEQLEAHGVPVTLRLYDGVAHVRVVAALAPPLQWIAATLDDVTEFVTESAHEQ
ncbi:alpha/beta hydrolase [Thioalkalivibrio sp. XN8]|uniref:alpha/beta hydrolase n=1 Tax=Thioalkalivibrio sp. XN8 TaxID=2712863 RepID=UPI0013E9C204|nr:alpha/beta hydrolase [Thioalkalivibrio sp. XN8]NGP53118.1 alpha/beta hydrolase [Thioalkalivibrio sp. XN8]